MITRPIDDTGRICIPMEFRKALGVDKRGALAMELRGNQIIIEKSYDMCCICGGNSALEQLPRGKVCKPCFDDLIGVAALECLAANGKET